MFDTTDPATLCQLLNSYPLPMFAAERADAHHAFRLLCVNTAYTQCSGLQTSDVEGMRPSDLMSAEDGARVESRFAYCSKIRQTLSFEEARHLDNTPRKWRTTLFHVAMKGAAQRIIGLSMVQSDQKRPAVILTLPQRKPNERSACANARSKVRRALIAYQDPAQGFGASSAPAANLPALKSEGRPHD